MTITLTEIPKSTNVIKARCSFCNKVIHSIGFMEESKCEGITVKCKFCGRIYVVAAK